MIKNMSLIYSSWCSLLCRLASLCRRRLREREKRKRTRRWEGVREEALPITLFPPLSLFLLGYPAGASVEKKRGIDVSNFSWIKWGHALFRKRLSLFYLLSVLAQFFDVFPVLNKRSKQELILSQYFLSYQQKNENIVQHIRLVVG